MSTPEAVLVCVLAMLGRAEKDAVPVRFVAVRPLGVSPTAEAWVHRREGVIYILTATETFREAQHGRLDPLRKIASIYAHEEWHVRHGEDERAAYEAQLTALTLLGAPPGGAMYIGVVRAMQRVIKRQREAGASQVVILSTTEPPVPSLASVGR